MSPRMLLQTNWCRLLLYHHFHTIIFCAWVREGSYSKWITGWNQISPHLPPPVLSGTRLRGLKFGLVDPPMLQPWLYHKITHIATPPPKHSFLIKKRKEKLSKYVNIDKVSIKSYRKSMKSLHGSHSYLPIGGFMIHDNGWFEIISPI